MLYQDFLNNDKKIIHKWLHYFPIYERHFSKFVNQSTNMWEIGVYKGGSLQMWKRYLGPFANIIGIDIDPECKQHEEDQIKIYIGNQSDTTFLEKIVEENGSPDIVLDDGSHVMEDVNKTFEFLYNIVSKNGIYMVEDMHTAYWSEYGGGLKRQETFIEKCKDLIDSLNARHIKEVGIDTSFANSTYSMCFYDSIVVFEKTKWNEENFKAIMTP